MRPINIFIGSSEVKTRRKSKKSLLVVARIVELRKTESKVNSVNI